VLYHVAATGSPLLFKPTADDPFASNFQDDAFIDTLLPSSADDHVGGRSGALTQLQRQLKAQHHLSVWAHRRVTNTSSATLRGAVPDQEIYVNNARCVML
jgi:hypothetical protein